MPMGVATAANGRKTCEPPLGISILYSELSPHQVMFLRLKRGHTRCAVRSTVGYDYLRASKSGWSRTVWRFDKLPVVAHLSLTIVCGNVSYLAQTQYPSPVILVLLSV